MARYTITHEGETILRNYPGVTTVTGLIDKSTPLMKWAVNQMQKWLHKEWPGYVTDEVKEALKKDGPVWIEFESKEDYFKMLEEAKDHYQEVSDDAKIVGNCVHDLSHEYIKSRIKNYDFDLEKLFPQVIEKHKLPEGLEKTVQSRFQNTVVWFEENVIKFIETEQPICSKAHGFCGTFDILAELKNSEGIVGGLYIVDIKSSKDFYEGQAKQAAGYKIGREEGGNFHLTFKNDNDKENVIIEEHDIKFDPIKIDGIGILTTNFKDEGKVKFKDYTDVMDIKENAFLKLLAFYYDDKNRRLKNNPFTLKGRKQGEF